MSSNNGCIVCGELNNIEKYCSKDDHNYLSCSKCGLIYIDRIPRYEAMYNAYDGGYWKALRRKLVAPFRSFSAVKNYSSLVERAEKIVTFVESQQIEKVAKPKLLDIGCNKGFLLNSAIGHGYEVYGVEFVPELVAAFKRKYKQYAKNIHTGQFSQNYNFFTEGMLDVVTAIDVIEHFEDPRQDVRKIYNILNHGGVFVLRTPDSDAPQAKGTGANWGALKPLEHLYLFNKSNLVRFLKDIGFREVEFFDPIEEGDGNFMAVARK